MGGSSKKQTVGYKYHLGMHMILCHGPADKLLGLRCDDRAVWSGSVSSNKSIGVSKPGLFGGESREGGVSGVIDLDMGEDDQPTNDYLVSRLGSNIPAFRKVVGLVFRQVYLGMNPYLKKWSALLQRIHVRQNGLAQWYDSKAQARTYTLQFDDLVEDFGDGLAPYSLVSGSSMSGFSVVSTTYGLGMRSSSSGGGAWIGRSIVALERPTSISFWFRVESVGNDDAGRIAFINSSGSTVFELVTVRESGTDPLRRAHINPPYGGSGQHISDEQLEQDVWHKLAATFDWDANQLTVTISKGGVSVGDVVVALSAVENISSLRFGADTNISGTGRSVFADIRVQGQMSAGDMNPAHIVRECLTDPDWGMGYPESDIDDDSFAAAADTLHAEGMGMSLLWDRQTEIQDFIKEVVKHIDAALYVDRTTGKFRLTLIRDDYDENDLLVLDESNVEKVEGFTRRTPAEMINEVTVKYWNAQTRSEATVTAQDIALAQMQGAAIGTTVNYPGFTSSELAARAAFRDLRTLSSPLASCTIYANRDAALLNIGGVFKLDWPDLDIEGLVLRVTSIAFGSGRSNKVRVTCTEDVFSTPVTPIVSPGEVEWDDPSGGATAYAERRVATETPYYELVQTLGQTDADSRIGANSQIGYLVVAAGRPSGAISATVAVDAGAGFEDVAALDFCPSAELAADVGPDATTFSLADADSLEDVELGTHAQVGDELVRVDSVDTGTNTITVGRAVLDTVPAAHLAGTPVLFWDAFSASDQVEYVDGEVLSVKMKPASGSGVLENDDVPTDTVVMDSRAFRPYPPGNVQINGEYFPADAVGTLTLTWAHRDRLQQTAGELYDFLDGNIGPEAGTTYSVRVSTYPGGALLVEEAGISGTTSSALDPEYDGDVLVELFSVRDGIESYQRFSHVMEVTSAPPITDEIYMDFEGTDGAAVFLDEGAAASTWTRSGSGVALTTTTALDGSSSLLVTATTDYLEADYTSANQIPASTDWDLSFKCRAATWVSGGLGRYVLSAQGPSANASDTAIALATNASRQLQLIMSNGTTRSVIISGPTLSDNTTYDILVTRRGTTMSLTVNGGTPSTGTFAGSVNFPAGRKWRIGKPEASASSASSLRFDRFRLTHL